MTDIYRNERQTVDQLMLRQAAAAENPEFATLEGRALQDVKDTIAYLALGMSPETVLGGLIRSQYGLLDSTYLPVNDRSIGHIAAAGMVDPVRPNDRGDRLEDVLEGLITLGFVEKVFTPNSVDSALLDDDDSRKVMGRPTYRLVTDELPLKVKARLEMGARHLARVDLNTLKSETKRRRFRSKKD